MIILKNLNQNVLNKKMSLSLLNPWSTTFNINKKKSPTELMKNILLLKKKRKTAENISNSFEYVISNEIRKTKRHFIYN